MKTPKFAAKIQKKLLGNQKLPKIKNSKVFVFKKTNTKAKKEINYKKLGIISIIIFCILALLGGISVGTYYAITYEAPYVIEFSREKTQLKYGDKNVIKIKNIDKFIEPTVENSAPILIEAKIVENGLEIISKNIVKNTKVTNIEIIIKSKNYANQTINVELVDKYDITFKSNDLQIINFDKNKFQSIKIEIDYFNLLENFDIKLDSVSKPGEEYDGSISYTDFEYNEDGYFVYQFSSLPPFVDTKITFIASNANTRSVLAHFI